MRVGVQKFVDATFQKFGDKKTSEEIIQTTLGNGKISVYLFRQLLDKPHVTNRLAFIPANAVRNARFLVRHNVTNQYIVAVERETGNLPLKE